GHDHISPGQTTLELHLDWWDDNVGVFEPELVLVHVYETFPNTILDFTDYQEQRLLRELAFWETNIADLEQRTAFIRQSKRNYRTNGPTFKFTIPFKPDWRVEGIARRLSIRLFLPAGFPLLYRQQLETFLRSLEMGRPTFEEETDNDSPISATKQTIRETTDNT
nr:hypothetical protein [Chloroflexaceae bacterium]